MPPTMNATANTRGLCIEHALDEARESSAPATSAGMVATTIAAAKCASIRLASKRPVMHVDESSRGRPTSTARIEPSWIMTVKTPPGSLVAEQPSRRGADAPWTRRAGIP